MKSKIRVLILIPPLSHRVNPLIEKNILLINEVTNKVEYKELINDFKGYNVAYIIKLIIDGI